MAVLENGQVKGKEFIVITLFFGLLAVAPFILDEVAKAGGAQNLIRDMGWPISSGVDCG